MSDKRLSKEELGTFGESLDALLNGIPAISQLALLFARLEAVSEHEREFPPPRIAKLFLDGCSLNAGATEVESNLVYVCKVKRADGAVRVFGHEVKS